MMQVSLPVLHQFDPVCVFTEADDCFAVYNTVQDVFRAAMAFADTLERCNATLLKEDKHLDR
eukprot:UN01257